MYQCPSPPRPPYQPSVEAPASPARARQPSAEAPAFPHPRARTMAAALPPSARFVRHSSSVLSPPRSHPMRWAAAAALCRLSPHRTSPSPFDDPPTGLLQVPSALSSEHRHLRRFREVNIVSSLNSILSLAIFSQSSFRCRAQVSATQFCTPLGDYCLPDTKFRNAIDTALADKECCEKDSPKNRISCFRDKALVNIGADLAGLVRGHVSFEVDARLAYDMQGIVRK